MRFAVNCCSRVTIFRRRSSEPGSVCALHHALPICPIASPCKSAGLVHDRSIQHERDGVWGVWLVADFPCGVIRRTAKRPSIALSHDPLACLSLRVVISAWAYFVLGMPRYSLLECSLCPSLHPGCGLLCGHIHIILCVGNLARH